MRRHIARRVTSAATATATIAALAFAPAVTAPDAAADLPALDLRVERDADGALTRSLNGMQDRLGLTAEDDLRDPMTWRSLARRNLEAQGVATFAPPTDADEARTDCEGDCTTEAVPVAAAVFGTGVGDLDGDGAEDVLVLGIEYDEEADEVVVATEARSAVTGAVLWRMADAGFGYLVAAPDLDGDGLDDLVRISFDGDYVDEECATEGDDGWCSTFAFEDVITVTGLRGSDGSALASHSVTATYAERYSEGVEETTLGSRATYSVEMVITGAFSTLLFADLDGDGLPSLVHEDIDVSFVERASDDRVDLGVTSLGTTSEYSAAEDLASEVVVTDPVSGASVVAIDRPDALALLTLVSDGELDRLLVDVEHELGERSSECVVALCSGGLPGDEPTVPAPTRAMYAPDMTVLWEVELDPDLYTFGAVDAGDLDGDGTADLLDLAIDLDTFDDVAVAVSGATGAELWRAELAIGRLSETGLVGLALDYDEEATGDVVAYGRLLDPATGAVVEQREVARFSFDEAMEEPEGEADTETDQYLSVRLQPLRGGAVDLLVEQGTTEYLFDEYCETYEDEDGVVEYCYYEYEVIAEHVDVAGYDGADLGTLFTAAEGGYLARAADLDGDADVELLFGFDGELSTLVAQQQDGAVLWTLAEHGIDALVEGTDDALDLLTYAFGSGALDMRDGADLGVRWSVG